MSNPIVFDIETRPGDQIDHLIPPFDPAEVKVGNMKDPELIRAKIQDAEEKHRLNFYEKAALSPDSGQVVAIGFIWEDGHEIIYAEKNAPEGEARVISHFWEIFNRSKSGEAFQEMIGHNIIDFDLPFLVARSWALGIDVPPHAFKIQRNGKFIAWSDNFIDTRLIFMMNRKEARASLDAVSRFFGLGGKDKSGKDFWRMFQDDRESALAYLKQDLDLTWGVARKMRIV